MYHQGTFVIFIGSSGSGKDSLIYASYERLLSELISVHRVKRWITRPNHFSEQFFSVNEEDFQQAINSEKFVLWWHIYNTYYGIPHSEVDPHLAKGKLVLVNLSRTQCSKALKLYPEAKIVLLKVPPEIAKKRIEHRARDKGGSFQDRLKRLYQDVPIPFPELVIQNDGAFDTSLDVLVEFLKAITGF